MKHFGLGTLVLSLSTLALGACTVNNSSSDEAFSTDFCDGAMLDEAGRCRLPDGRYAESECCAGQVRCSWSVDSALGDTTDDLVAQSVSSRRFTVDNAEQLSELEAQQIVQATVHLGLMDPNDELDVVFQAADEGIVDILDVEVPSDATAYDWISFYAGDNEVGVIFESDTLDVVAEISDGDIMGCVSM